MDGYHTEIEENLQGGRLLNMRFLVLIWRAAKRFKCSTLSLAMRPRLTLKILNHLIKRGLKKAVIVSSADFQGLIETIRALYPLTDHQLCYVHLQRNVRSQMGKDDAAPFNKELDNIKLSSDVWQGRARFEKCCQQYQTKHHSFIRTILGKADDYLRFLAHNEEIRIHISTTIAVESLSSSIEQIRMKLGGHSRSVNILAINLILQVDR